VIPHPDQFAIGAALGATVAAIVWVLARTDARRLVALLPAAAVTAWLAAPHITDAVNHWDRPAALSIIIVLVGLGVAGAAGGSAAEPLGSTGVAWSLAGVTGATALAVADTEGPMLLLGALTVPIALASVGDARVPDWAAGLTALVVAAVATGGATLGPGAAVGSYGCIAVLLAAAPLNRHAHDPGAGVVPAWVAVPIITAIAVGVARLGAVRSTSVRALLVAAAGVVIAAVALELAAAVTRWQARPEP